MEREKYSFKNMRFLSFFFLFCPVLLFSILFSPSLLFAQNIELIDKEITLNTDQLNVARAKALKEIALQLTREVMGEERYLKEQVKINRFIIPGKNRYILSSQLSPPVLTETGAFEWTVKAKVSRENLKKLLLEHDLFYTSKGASCVLPLVYFISYLRDEGEGDQTGTATAHSWLWWKELAQQTTGQGKAQTRNQTKNQTRNQTKNQTGNQTGNQTKDQTGNQTGEGGGHSLLRRTAEVFFDLLEEQLLLRGFYTLNPIFQRITEAFPFDLNKRKKLILKDFKPLAEFYTCDIALSGYIQWGGAELEQMVLSNKVDTGDGGKGTPRAKNYQFGKVFLKLSNIKTGRFFFHLKRSFLFSTDSGKNSSGALKRRVIPLSARSQLADILNEMARQLAWYQKNGSMALQQMILSVQGPLSYAQKEILKRLLIREVPGIKSLTERWMASGRVVYSAEIAEPTEVIAESLKNLQIPGFVIQLKGTKKGQAEIYAKQR